ncbi:MAG: outer membrane protein assembly factor BamA [Candidatus Brocadiaceae bacterium]|nr:outer membrane protein assembly factor BamA [Candidatus Brocadiaceae bacterium]
MKVNKALSQAAYAIMLVITLSLLCQKAFSAETSETKQRIIREVEIQGNQRISSAAIRSSIRVKEGDIYNAQVVSQDVDAIWSLGFFENIELSLEEISGGLKVVFIVSERPTIDEIRFRGNENVKTKKLANKLEIKPGDYLKYHLLKIEEEKIREYYVEKRYHWAKVQAETKVEDWKTVLIFIVDEGPRLHVADIEFKGNANFKRKKLLKQMETRQKRFPALVFHGRFEEKIFEEDIEKLKEFYMNNGWLDVEVGWEITYRNDNTEMYVTIHIKEGERYYVESLDIHGAAIFTEEELKKNLKLKEGGPFFLDAVEKDTYDLRLLYGAQGHLATRVKEEHTFSSEGAKVHVKFFIEEKDRYYIEKITIVGNDKTKDNVIRRQLTFFPGERLNVAKVRDSQRRLSNTGYFDMESGAPAGISFEPGSGPDKQNILIEVKEGRTGMLRFGGGFGANVGAFGDVSYTDRNFDVFDFPKSWDDFLSGDAFRGSGEILTLRFSPGTERTEIMLSLTNPSVFDSPYSVGGSIFNYSRIFEDYQQKSAGGKISVGREIVRDFFVKVVPAFENIDIDRDDDEETTPQDILDVVGTHLKAGLTLSANISKTDNFFAPTKGFEGESSFEFSSLDVDVVKFKIKATKYQPLFEVPKWGKHVLAYGGAFWLAESTSGEDVPIFERFYTGGYGSIRGFQFRGISPLDQETDDQIGGDLLLLMNTEYLVPLYKDIVRVALFVDGGKVDKSASDINFERFRVSTGLGLRLNVPFLGQSTISIDYGIPVLQEDGDDLEAFSFNFGGGSSF